MRKVAASPERRDLLGDHAFGLEAGTLATSRDAHETMVDDLLGFKTQHHGVTRHLYPVVFIQLSNISSPFGMKEEYRKAGPPSAAIPALNP